MLLLKNRKKILPQLSAIAFLMLSGMSLYEFLKQMIHPDISIWQSHIVTIVFSTICAVIAGYFILRKHIDLTETLIRKNKESEYLRNELENTVSQLKITLSEIKTLTGLLPICSSCKKIRDENGSWIQIERYIRERSEAEFTHDICQECFKKLYPDILEEIEEKICLCGSGL
jgi:hypothetical protein